jgi:hypothetical protein
VVTMESQAFARCLQHFSSELQHIEQGTLGGVASGDFRVDSQNCKERVAVRCLTCLHQLWSKDKEGQLRLTFRKSDRGVLMGYLVSSEIPKSKHCKQIVCLSCINNMVGSVTDSDGGLSVTLSGRKNGMQDAVILRRETQRGPWIQTLELNDELLSFFCRENARTMPGERQNATAATQIGNQGMSKGSRARVESDLVDGSEVSQTVSS